VVLFAGTNLHLAVLVPTTDSWPEGRASIGAIALAVDAANAQGIQPGSVRAIPGGMITYSWREADCEPSAAVAALTRILDEGPVDAVIGPDCSVACESTAILTAGLDIPQISYSCSSIALSDKKIYPTVRLTIAVSVTGTCAYLAHCRNYCSGCSCVAVCSHYVELRKLDASSDRVCDVG
jgi:ABC-type branched-subunit amino acid transport system substrate-binding protein